jgi:hypothetical protein
MRWAGRVALMRNTYKNLVVRAERTRPLRRQAKMVRSYNTGSWENRLHQAQERDQWRGLVNIVINLRFP